MNNSTDNCPTLGDVRWSHSHTGTIHGAKVMVSGGDKGILFYAIRLPYAPAGVDQLVYTGNLEGNTVADFLSQLNAWATSEDLYDRTGMGCLADGEYAFDHRLSEWAQQAQAQGHLQPGATSMKIHPDL